MTISAGTEFNNSIILLLKIGNNKITTGIKDQITNMERSNIRRNTEISNITKTGTKDLMPTNSTKVKTATSLTLVLRMAPCLTTVTTATKDLSMGITIQGNFLKPRTNFLLSVTSSVIMLVPTQTAILFRLTTILMEFKRSRIQCVEKFPMVKASYLFRRKSQRS